MWHGTVFCLTYRGKRVRTIKRRQVMAREADVTRIFLARASLHYDAARAALPLCRSCGDTVSRSRYSVGAHQAITCTGERIREDSTLDGGQWGVPITPIPRIDFPYDVRRDDDYASNGNENNRFNNCAPKLSSYFPGNLRTRIYNLNLLRLYKRSRNNLINWLNLEVLS